VVTGEVRERGGGWEETTVADGVLGKGERVPHECDRRRVDLHFAATAETVTLVPHFEDAALDEEPAGAGLRAQDCIDFDLHYVQLILYFSIVKGNISGGNQPLHANYDTSI
jgi:hypothetical protein